MNSLPPALRTHGLLVMRRRETLRLMTMAGRSKRTLDALLGSDDLKDSSFRKRAFGNLAVGS